MGHNCCVSLPSLTFFNFILRCGPLIDLCRGPHVRHTGKIKTLKIHKVRHAGNRAECWCLSSRCLLPLCFLVPIQRVPVSCLELRTDKGTVYVLCAPVLNTRASKWGQGFGDVTKSAVIGQGSFRSLETQCWSLSRFFLSKPCPFMLA